MAKKKSKSNVSFIVAGFLFALGILMFYFSASSGNKGLVPTAIFSIAIGVALIVVARKTRKKRR